MKQRAANVQATKMTRKNAYTVVTTFMMTSKNAYMVVTRWSITTRVPVAATAVRTGRGSVANPGCKPEAAPCQVEETDNFFIRSSVNYRTNEELSEVIEWASVMEVVCSLQPIIEQTKNSLKLVKEHPSKNSLKSVKERQSKEVEQQYNFWHWSTITGRRQSLKECGREQRKTKNFASNKKPSRFIILCQ